jgi:hypothetical protein
MQILKLTMVSGQLSNGSAQAEETDEEENAKRATDNGQPVTALGQFPVVGSRFSIFH